MINNKYWTENGMEYWQIDVLNNQSAITELGWASVNYAHVTRIQLDNGMLRYTLSRKVSS